MDRPAIPVPPHKGGCLCGAVRYRLDGSPLAVNACHCADCKMLSGSMHALMILAASADFARECGAVDRYRKRAASGREIDLLRCSTCGVRLWHEPLSSPQFVFILAGTLDDPSWAVPASHIWAEEAAPSVVFEDDALVIEGQPADRQTLMEAFAKAYGKAHL